MSVAETSNADHGRIEVRRAIVSHDVSWLKGPKTAAGGLALLPGLACLGMIEATVTRAGKTSTTRHYHLLSRPPTAEAYLAAARVHWSIKTVSTGFSTFDEDRACNCKNNGPENLAILRQLALNMLKRSRPKFSVRRKRERSGWSDDFARTILGQMR